MSQSINLKAAGLQTFYQSLQEISPGALLKANNTVIDQSGIISPRRGITAYSQVSPDPIKQLLQYKGRVLRHTGTTLSYDNGTGTFLPFDGDFIETSPQYRLKALEVKSNFYVATDQGVKKISARSPSDFQFPDVVQNCGGPKAISGSLSLVSTSGFLNQGATVSYRVLWLYTDPNQNLILGAPSSSMIIFNNEAGSRNVEVRFQVPYNVRNTNYIYRVYRSEQSTFGTPSDEVYQVLEGFVSDSQLTVGEVVVVDTAPEVNRVGGVPLYTNQFSGEGALQANEPPPVAKDLAFFKGSMFYANTRTRHRLQLNMLSVENMIAGVSSIVISGLTYTFDTVENPTLKRVKLGSLEETAKSLVKVINSDPDELVAAYYVSNIGDDPGKMILENKDLEDISFYVGTTQSNIAADFSPVLGTGATITTQTVSSVEKFGNRIYYSKFQEVEAVPILNYLDVGTRDDEVERIIALRESLFIFKGDGVYRLTGENTIWSVSIYDNTSIIKAPDSAVTLANQCFYFSNQGVVKLSESTIDPISTPIEDKLLPFLATCPAIKTVSFSVAYESDKSLLFWTVLKSSDTVATVCYRYNYYTNAWTEWKISKTCAVLNVQQDRLYFGSADNYVEIERKSFNRFDYADREYISSLKSNSIFSNVIVVDEYQPEKQQVEIGDVILQNQYVTISEFNSLLKQLDNDGRLKASGIYQPGQLECTPSAFYDALKMKAGDSLDEKLLSLRDKLRVADPPSRWTTPDSHGNTDYQYTSTTSFSNMQVQYNKMIDRLNQSPTAFRDNYPRSLEVKTYEASVVKLDRTKFRVELSLAPSFMQGELIIYKSIPTEIEYAPQHDNDPASFKQFSTGTFIFDRRSFSVMNIGYSSDSSSNVEYIPTTSESYSIYGGVTWGENSIWGGQGDQAQLRTYVPLRKQRCRFLNCNLTHRVALESYKLYGLTLSVRRYVVADRGYK
jgi:hypothetical protein